MAKIIEKENGERIIVGNDVPDDIQYDTEALDLFLAKKIFQKQKLEGKEVSSSINPVALVFSFENEDYPTVPIQPIKITNKLSKLKITGTMLTSDFFWMMESDIKTIKFVTIAMEHRTFNLGIDSSYKIESFSAKDINGISVGVNLSLIKTI